MEGELTKRQWYPRPRDGRPEHWRQACAARPRDGAHHARTALAVAAALHVISAVKDAGKERGAMRG